MRRTWFAGLFIVSCLALGCSSSDNDSTDALAAAGIEGARRGGTGPGNQQPGMDAGGTSQDAPIRTDAGGGAAGAGGGQGGSAGAGGTGGTVVDARPAEGPSTVDANGPKLDGAPKLDVMMAVDSTPTVDAAVPVDTAPSACTKKGVCDDLQNKYADALKKAKVCTPASTCGVLVKRSLGCPGATCTTSVTNSKELDQLSTEWKAAGCDDCGRLCLAILCPVVTGGQCGTGDLAPSTVSAAAAPGTGGPIIGGPRVGTCTD